MDLSVRGAMSLTEDDLRATAYDVLTGTLRRNELATLPNALALYAGLTMMLALPYKLAAENRVEGNLDDALCDVVLRGKAICQLRTPVVTSVDLRELARSMKLCRYDREEKRTTLLPPDELVQLVEQHRNHHAVHTFRRDMEAGIAYHAQWLRRLTTTN